METRPPKKSLRMAPFAIQATRGLLRDERSRRKTMAISLLIVGGHVGSGFDRVAPVVESARTSLAVHFVLVRLRLGNNARVVAGSPGSPAPSSASTRRAKSSPGGSFQGDKFRLARRPRLEMRQSESQEVSRSLRQAEAGPSPQAGGEDQERCESDGQSRNQDGIAIMQLDCVFSRLELDAEQSAVHF